MNTQVSQNNKVRGPGLSAASASCMTGVGGAKLGVRVGLGLLAMGDLARGYIVSPLATSQELHESRHTGDPRGHGKRGLVNTAPVGATGAFVVSPGGIVGNGVVTCGTRASGIRRRRRISCAAMAPRDMQQEQQLAPPSSSRGSIQPVPSLSVPPVAIAPTTPTRIAQDSAATVTTPSNGGVSRGRWRDTSFGRAGRGPVGRGAGSRVRVDSRLPDAGGGRGARVSVNGVAGDSGRPLGVLSRAENGGKAAKKAKVKALYLRAQRMLSGHPPSTVEAIEMLEEALLLDPRDGHSWLLMARTQERMGARDAARDAFVRATAACPNNVHLWQAWGVLEDKFGNLSKARSLFEKGLEADRGNPFVCHAWGLLEEKDGNTDLARELFKMSRPRVAIATALGELEAQQGNLEAARTIFKQGLDRLSAQPAQESKDETTRWIGPGRKASSWTETLAAEGPGQLLLSWAKVEEQNGGDPALAQQLIERARAVEPKNVKAHIERARFELRRGNVAAARVILSKVADLPQEKGTLFNLWATLETKEGNLQTALRITKAATKRFPEDMSLLQTEGTVLGRLRQYGAAIDCYRRSIALRPAAPAYVAWAMLVSQLATEHGPKEDESEITDPATTAPIATERAQENSAGPSAERSYGGATNLNPTVVNGEYKLGPGAEVSVDGRAEIYDAGRSVTVEASVADDSGVRAAGSDSGRSSRSKSPYPVKNIPDDVVISHMEARRLFELGMKADPTHGPLFNAYGTMEMKLGNMDRARAVYERGIEARCRGMASVWQGLGCLETSLGNKDKAREVFRRGIIHCARDEVSFLYHSLGSLELASGRPAEAKTAFVEGIGRYPKSTQLLLGAALAEIKCGTVEAAREFFKRAVQADPSHAHAWQAWGVMECRAGNHSVARTLWESGLKNCPRHGPLWQAYAVMEHSMGEAGRARKLFEAGVERCRDHVQLHQAWAVMEGREGDLEAARKLVLEGLRINPYHGALWTVYGIVERQDGADDKARKVFRLGTRACPDHGPLYRAWAQTEFIAGCYDEAGRIYEKGLAICPTHQRLYVAYADMEATQGNTQAIDWLTDRGEKALKQAGAPPEEHAIFLERMAAIAAATRFDATAIQDREDGVANDIFDLD